MFFCCISSQQGIAQYFDDVNFEYIDLKNDKAPPSVNTYDIIQDERGYIWVATSKGVKRYDGRNTLTLSNENLAEDVLAKVVYQDSKKSIWIGTQGDGLCRYNYLNDELECFTQDSTDVHSINHNDILSIYEDSKGQLWIGTEGGLNKFDYDTNQFTSYDDILPRAVLSIQEDSKQHLWLGRFDSF